MANKFLVWAKRSLDRAQSSFFNYEPIRRIKLPRSQPHFIEAVSLRVLWQSLAKEYFPEIIELENYKIAWSKRRQKRTLGSCNITHRKVVVAKELQHPDYAWTLAPLIYHEMCHAALGLGVTRRGRRKLWHGPQFKCLEARHPDIVKLNAWIKTGGWAQAVRRSRSIEGWRKRK